MNKTMTVDQFVKAMMAPYSSPEPYPLLAEMRTDWCKREMSDPDTFPQRLTWADWCYQLDSYRNAKDAGMLHHMLQVD